MRLVTFETGGEVRFGALQGDYIVDLVEADRASRRMQNQASSGLDPAAFPTSVLDFLNAGEAARQRAAQALAFAQDPENLRALVRVGSAVAPSQVRFLPPVPRPGKIFCLGRNYREHAAEMGGEAPEYPMLFAKFANTLIGHGQPIVLPAVSDKVDYEAELAVVIGRRGHNISEETALDYVAGYSVFNDVSVRDWQKRTLQWLQGKTFDGTGPMGPALVTRDEVKDPHALGIALRLNGQVMQCANTSQFIFPIPAVIHYISQIATLEPGDVIATGTPSGVGFARKPPVFLKAGDMVEVEIESIGVLRNAVAAPAEG